MTVLQVSLKLLHPAVFIILFDVIFTKKQKCISMTEKTFLFWHKLLELSSQNCAWHGQDYSDIRNKKRHFWLIFSYLSDLTSDRLQFTLYIPLQGIFLLL